LRRRLPTELAPLPAVAITADARRVHVDLAQQNAVVPSGVINTAGGCDPNDPQDLFLKLAGRRIGSTLSRRSGRKSASKYAILSH